MSNLGNAQQLQRATSQLPVDVYFDQALLAREKERLFQQGPAYVGHAHMVPNVGDFHTLAGEAEGRVLVRNSVSNSDHPESGIELLSNVCRHRQAIMLNGKGNTSNIVCPLHRWTYDLGGKLLGAPHFDDNPCLNLGKTPLQNWQGLLFEGPRDVRADLAGMGVAPDLDFTGYMLDSVKVHECHYNWKTFIEVYLEDYHVVPFHPGLGKFVECGDLDWQFGDWYSVQTVGIHNFLQQAGSPTYQRWHDQVKQFGRGQLPKHGAVWLTYYPNIMVEWYPWTLVISTLIPDGPEKTKNIVEFYYPEEIVLFERDFVAAQQAAYMETCIEDDEIAERMDKGRKALLARGENQVGPYQSPMEDGMQHFHEFYRRVMDFTR